MRPHWHFFISLAILIVYGAVTKTPPSFLSVFIGTAFGVLIDVDHVLHALIFQRRLTLNYLKHFDLVGFYREFKDGGAFDNIWFHGILWKKLLYYFFMHGIFILFVYWISPYIFADWYIPIRVAIMVHYICDVAFHTYTNGKYVFPVKERKWRI